MRAPPKPKPTLTREQAWGWNDLVVIAAFRYSCGQSTYMSKVCAEWLVEIWPLLGLNTRAVIERDLEASFKDDDEARQKSEVFRPLGWDMDRKEWEKVRALWAKGGA